jgi:hypothetical protein
VGSRRTVAFLLAACTLFVGATVLLRRTTTEDEERAQATARALLEGDETGLDAHVAVWVLASHDPALARRLLLRRAATGDMLVVANAALFVRQEEDLLALAAAPDPRARLVGVRALGRLCDPATVDLLAARLDDPNPAVRAAAKAAITSPNPADPPQRFPVIGFRAAVALSPAVHARGLALLADPDPARRETGLDLLDVSPGPAGDAATIAAVDSLRGGDPDPAVRAQASALLARWR